MKKLIIVLMLSLSLSSKADDVFGQHFVPHFVLSYGIELGSYEIFKNAFRMDRTNAVIFSVFTTLTVGLMYKAMEMNQNGWPADTGRSMLFNAIGTGAAVGTVYAFHF
jgi:hypothetical protein